MTKDDPITGALTDKFFDPVINATSDEDRRAWLRRQPSDEIERFLNFWDWTPHRDEETIVRQELWRKRRIEKFEELGEKTLRADMDAGGDRHVGGTPAVRQLARDWLAEREAAGKVQSFPDTNPFILQPNFFGLGIDLKKLWRKGVTKWGKRD